MWVCVVCWSWPRNSNCWVEAFLSNPGCVSVGCRLFVSTQTTERGSADIWQFKQLSISQRYCSSTWHPILALYSATACFRYHSELVERCYKMHLPVASRASYLWHSKCLILVWWVGLHEYKCCLCATAADSCMSLESLQLANWTSHPSNKALSYLYFARGLKSQQEEWGKRFFLFFNIMNLDSSFLSIVLKEKSSCWMKIRSSYLCYTVLSCNYTTASKSLIVQS